jgi:4a-hydroxytetrahydrobiopterin dehydratase
MPSAAELAGRHCRPTQTALPEADAAACLAALDGWTLQDGKIVKTFALRDYYQTLAFVNALAWIIHAEDHHPELMVTYNRCTVKFDTHSVNGGRGGLSENDFICAAKADALFRQRGADGAPA